MTCALSRLPRGGKPVEVGLRSFVLGEAVQSYTLRRSARRTLAITVEPGGALGVTAPEQATIEQVEAILRKRRSWIRRQIREMTTLPPPPPPRAWVSGETHRYLGRQYRLKVVQATEESVRLSGGFFRVTVKDRTATQRVQRLMERWLLLHARETFERRLAGIVERHTRLRIKEPPPLIVRRLQKRWGSCSSAGRVLMNVEAVKLPVGCIDYLLVHELCHLRVPNHGAAFWRLVEACMPDWDRWKKRLDLFEV